MTLNSINTNIAAYSAQANISKASTMASTSIARLSSGNRIVHASDDVAAMSTGTSLRTNVTTLKMALINTSQGSSLLQVADGALSQVTDILQRQKAIAVQAGSGSLSSAERSFLNQEFQNLSKEIDRLVSQTNFNGVTLLDGSLSEKVDVANVDSAAAKGKLEVSFSDPIVAAENLIVNGVTFTAVAANATAVQFVVGGSLTQTLDNLVNQLNASTNTAISQATYTRVGNSLVITSDSGGLDAQNFFVDADSSTSLQALGEGSVIGQGANSYLNLFAGGPTGPITATNIDTYVVTAGAAAASTPFQTGQTLTVNGTNVITFAANQTLQDVVNTINASTATHGYTARIIGRAGAYNIQFQTSQLTTDGSYTVANRTTLTFAGAAATFALAGFAANGNANTVNNFNYYMSGVDNLGVAGGDVVGVGTIGNAIITDQNQLKGQSQIVFPDIADAALTSTTNFGNPLVSSITIGGATGINFAWTTNTAGTSATEAAIGDTLGETLDNMVAKINSYRGTAEQNYILDQIEAVREGNTISLRSKVAGNPTLIDGVTAVAIATANLPTGASATSATITGGQTGGVDTSGIINKDFMGTISGFTASYNSNDNVTLSVKIGDSTYSGTVLDTTPAANTTVRLFSDNGGYFDIQTRANSGLAVTNQAGAASYAQLINAAFSSLTFYQTRDVSSFTGNEPILTNGIVTGTMIGTSVELSGTDFTDVKIDSIRVTAPQGSSENGSITFTINGTDYTASNVGSQLGANQRIKFTSSDDANKYLLFKTGSVPIEFDTDEKAASFEQALQDAFGVGDGSAELKFQVGSTVEDTLSVGISNVSTYKLYGGLSLDVLTAESAATAADQIDKAIDIVTSVRADVGAIQSRFNFASANIESSVQNQDAARGVLLDTDIAAESTQFSTAQVQLQAGIAVLAQANLLPQNLLKLIG
ncbi:MAG: flagellin [Rickettsiales bacterium]